MIRKVNPVYSSYAIYNNNKSEQTMSELMKYGSTKQIAQLIGVVTYPMQDNGVTKEEVEHMVEKVQKNMTDTLDYKVDEIVHDILPPMVEDKVEEVMDKALAEDGKIMEEIRDKVEEKVEEIVGEEVEKKVVDVITGSVLEDKGQS